MAHADVRQQDEFGLLPRSFNDMAERLEGAIVTLRRFVADAAHELRTPLTALKTDLELAAGQGGDADRSASLAHAQAQVDRLASLSAGLLDLSRIAAGAPAERAPVDLAALVRQVSALKGAIVGLDPYPSLPGRRPERLRLPFRPVQEPGLSHGAPDAGESHRFIQHTVVILERSALIVAQQKGLIPHHDGQPPRRQPIAYIEFSGRSRRFCPG